jgi:anti-sigma factor RsiW
MSKSCDKALLVQADFDGELDAGQAASLAVHRSECQTCKAIYEQLHDTHQMLRTGLSYHRASPALRRVVSERIAELASATPGTVAPRGMRWQPWRRMTASFGLGAAIAVSLVLLLQQPGEGGLSDQIVASHVRALQPGHLADVASTDRHTVKPWFDGKIDFAPPVKDLAAQGFPLLGGRLDYLAGRPVAALVYGRAKHSINLFVWPETGAADAAPNISERNGYNMIHWRRDGMTLWAVSDLETRELSGFRRSVERDVIA